MSLKAFHIFFIAFCTLCSGAFGVWSLREYQGIGEGVYLLLAIVSLLAAVGLLVYGSWFLKKMRDVSFL